MTGCAPGRGSWLACLPSCHCTARSGAALGHHQVLAPAQRKAAALPGTGGRRPAARTSASNAVSLRSVEQPDRGSSGLGTRQTAGTRVRGQRGHSAAPSAAQDQQRGCQPRRTFATGHLGRHDGRPAQRLWALENRGQSWLSLRGSAQAVAWRPEPLLLRDMDERATDTSSTAAGPH
jgi:hypothetical protein